MTSVALNTFSAEELIKAVNLLDKPSALELALANKLVESKAEGERVNKVFNSIANIVDPEL